jgi:acylphosphatase
VQGIGFRWYVRERAQRLDVAGWVKNLDGGEVEIVASGPDTVMSDFLAAVREGPPGAMVRDIVPLAPVSAAHLPRPFAIVR